MAKKDLQFVVSTVGEQDRTALLPLPKGLDRFESRIETLLPLKGTDDLYLFSFEDNEWATAERLTIPQIRTKTQTRMKGAKVPGVDVFVRGRVKSFSPARTIRLRSAEKYEAAKFNYTGEISAPLRKLCEDLWAEFGDDPSLYNGGVHVCRKIAGSSSWSQHSWDDAIDLMIGSDMHLGDQIYRWLKDREAKYGGYCELLWRVASHYDHIHASLAPCHTGTPPCSKLTTDDLLDRTEMGDDGCILWVGPMNAKGYGTASTRLAHRVIYEALVEPIPEGLELDHLCRVRNCVNPDHLEPVEHRENVLRGQAGEPQRKRTHCPQGHEYSGENLMVTKRGHRACRECGRQATRASRLKRLELG